MEFASGQLTPHETAHIEHNEAKINHEVATDRKDNGGHLTRAGTQASRTISKIRKASRSTPMQA